MSDEPHGPLHSPVPDENDVPTILRMIAEQMEVERTSIHEAIAEVSSVLEQLDNLATVWGDEGVFRRCRDRLRAAIAKARGG